MDYAYVISCSTFSLYHTVVTWIVTYCLCWIAYYYYSLWLVVLFFSNRLRCWWLISCDPPFQDARFLVRFLTSPQWRRCYCSLYLGSERRLQFGSGRFGFLSRVPCDSRRPRFVVTLHSFILLLIYYFHIVQLSCHTLGCHFFLPLYLPANFTHSIGSHGF
jgi:hypothetical protein